MLARRHSPDFRLGAVLCIGACSLIVLSSAGSVRGAAPGKDSNKVDFNRDIRPLLSENCFKCHGPGEEDRKAKLRFDIREVALKPAKSGNVAIVPGAPEKSG